MGPTATGEAVPRLDTLHFNITRSCNLACAFCYARAVRGRSDDLPLAVIRSVVEDAAGLGARRVILSGGEPLVRPDWRDVARMFDMAGVEVSVATNGTLLRSDVVEFLAGLRNVTVAVSLDGSEATHDRLRAEPGAFARTIAGLRALKAGGVWFHLNATLFRGNLSEVSFLAKLARDLDCDVRLSLLHPNGLGEAMWSEALAPEEIVRVREFCHQMRQRGINIYVNLPPILQYLEDILPARGAACGWASRFCGVLANGDVTVCGVASDEPQLVAGSVRERRFAEIWGTSPLFQRTRSLRVADLGGVCGRCPFQTYCGGACRLSAFRATGDLLAPYSLCQRFYEEGYLPESLFQECGEAPPAAS